MSSPPADLNNVRLRRKIIPDEPKSDRKQKNISIKKASVILKKREDERTSEENEFLYRSAELTKEAASRLKRREELKQREVEFEDSEGELDEKCARLAQVISQAQYLVVYTGAGISTAARIPDYRGTSGIWTLLQQGKDIGEHDLTQAEPTYTHMALAQLHHEGRLKHVVSQNCDGLHLRSGLPRSALSEVHGNMYIEVCRNCRPYREYLRLFDVTESTARFNHRTQRRCYRCSSPLNDSIVHFGERGNLPWPLNWKGACRAAEMADVILCMGSSLKVLRKYPWLWCMDKPAKKRPKLFIVNLQWTPKDCGAAIKIHGKCDDVMRRLAQFLTLQVPDYKKENDPIFVHATRLCSGEEHTTSRRPLDLPESVEEEKIAETTDELPEVKPEVEDSKMEVVSDSKDELIVITVESDPPVCCEEFQSVEAHNEACTNFVEASHDVPVIMAPAFVSPPQFSIMEAMFFNYLYTLISSFGTYPPPTSSPALPDLPIPSTSKYDEEEPIEKKMKVEPPITVKCSFCTKQYNAEYCMFYVKSDAEFKDNSQSCTCCGDDDDDSDNENVEREEDTKDDAKDTEGKDEENDDIGKDDDAESKQEKDSEKLKSSVNPGWYGRGCRKRLKKKR